MAKKPPKETPHLRVRIELKLLSKLEKSREKNGRTLTGEIVARLQEGFETEERMETFRREWQSQLNDLRELAERHRLVAENREQELVKTYETLTGFMQEVRELQSQKAYAKMLGVLLGEDGKQKSVLLRRVALEIATWPQDWSTNQSIRNELEQRFRSTFATQKGEIEQ